MESDSMKFIRRADTSKYLEIQTVTIGSGGGSYDVTNLLKGDDLEAFEFEVEGRRFVLLGFESKD